MTETPGIYQPKSESEIFSDLNRTALDTALQKAKVLPEGFPMRVYERRSLPRRETF